MNTEERVALKSRFRIGELNNSHMQKYKSLTDSGYTIRHFTFYKVACEENKGFFFPFITTKNTIVFNVQLQNQKAFQCNLVTDT